MDELQVILCDTLRNLLGQQTADTRYFVGYQPHKKFPYILKFSTYIHHYSSHYPEKYRSILRHLENNPQGIFLTKHAIYLTAFHFVYK